MRVDLNCDMGEGGAFDEELMQWVSSVNIACGAHAGDLQTMQATMVAAKKLGRAVGAHPGYRDREQFGRREFRLSAPEVKALVAEQLATLKSVADEQGIEISHVKPHGALYNLAARDAATARAIAEAVATFDTRLRLVGLPKSELLRAGEAAGLTVAAEAFADRAYRADGSLSPRTDRDAVLSDPRAVARQVLDIVLHRRVNCVDGSEIPMVADTLCLHSDTADALGLAKEVRRVLEQNGVTVGALGTP